MRAMALVVLLSCGAPEEAETEPRIIIPGKVTPWLHVEGDAPDGKVMPTGVAFDARSEGWRVSCLNGVTPRIEFGRDGAAGRLFCGQPRGEF